jgi:hypothetical protein
VIGTMGSVFVMARRCCQSSSGSGVYWEFVNRPVEEALGRNLSAALPLAAAAGK